MKQGVLLPFRPAVGQVDGDIDLDDDEEEEEAGEAAALHYYEMYHMYV